MVPLTREIRLLFWAILGVIVPFGLLLYLLPGSTEVYWAWVISVPRSAILIGAAYLGAVVYYVLALRRNDWLQVRSGMGGLVAFSAVLLVATALDWERFRPYHITTLVWLAFYYGGLLLVPILTRTQARRMKMQEPEVSETSPGRVLATGWMIWLLARGLFYFGLAVFLVVWADTATGAWPWPIGELEIRVFAGQVVVVGFGAVVVLRNRRFWHDYVLGVILVGAIGVLQLLGLTLSATHYDWSAGLATALVLMFAEWIATPVFLLARYGTSRRDATTRHGAPKSEADRLRILARYGAQAIAVIYLALGVIGFAGFDALNPFDETGVGAHYLLHLIAVNDLHNAVHIAVGVAALLSMRGPAHARVWATIAGAALLILFVAGTVQALIEGLPRDQMFLGLLPLNSPGHVLHVVTGSIVLFLGLMWREDASRPVAT